MLVKTNLQNLPDQCRLSKLATSISWMSLRAEHGLSTRYLPRNFGVCRSHYHELVQGIACIAFGVGASGAAWLNRLALTDWLLGPKPKPGDLAEGSVTLTGYLPVSTKALLHIETAFEHIVLPSAPLAAVAVPEGAGLAEQEAALGLVAALRSRKDLHGCRMPVVVTLEAPTTRRETFELGLLERGAFVVRAGVEANGDHFHHFPLRASVYPRNGRLVCVDLADYLACWRPGRRASLHVLPGALELAREALDQLPAASFASALNLDLHPNLDGSGNALADLDQLASYCSERFLAAEKEGLVFTSSDRLDGKTGTADLVVIE